MRKWRNWQTRKPQELVGAIQWRFESSLPHQIFSNYSGDTSHFLPANANRRWYTAVCIAATFAFCSGLSPPIILASARVERRYFDGRRRVPLKNGSGLRLAVEVNQSRTPVDLSRPIGAPWPAAHAPSTAAVPPPGADLIGP